MPPTHLTNCPDGDFAGVGSADPLPEVPDASAFPPSPFPPSSVPPPHPPRASTSPAAATTATLPS
ncbi:hypothetical protein WKI71_23525 [Streptomyces sp. MS1.AVA.1]|uniref:Uncharacterized protein n=1 Tax=Streptomyces machairae TaxID=3134109 RepID=A0ABU8UN37_9ACTN